MDEADWFSTDLNENEILKLSLHWRAFEGDNVAPSLGLREQIELVNGRMERRFPFIVGECRRSVRGSQVRYQVGGARFQYDLQVELASVNTEEASLDKLKYSEYCTSKYSITAFMGHS